MATVCEQGGVASLIGKVKLLVKNVRLGEAVDGTVRAVASGNVDNCSHCYLVFKWSVGKRRNLKIEPSFGILEPFERQNMVLEIILDSVQKLILPNYFELIVETASKEQIEKYSSTIWNNRSLVEVRIPVELTFHDKPLDSNVEDDLAKDEKLNHISVAEIVNGIGKLDIRNAPNKSGKYNEKFSPTYAIISVGFGEPRYKLCSQTNDKYRAENFTSKYVRSIMVMPVDSAEKIPETTSSETFGKSKFSENITAVNRCNDDGIVESDSDLKLENAVKLDPVSNMDLETELFETIKLKEMLELFLQEEENFIHSSGKSTNNSESGSIEEIEGRVVRKNAAFKVGNGKQAAVIIGDKKNDDCSFDWTNNNTNTSSLETDMTEAEYECNSSRHVADGEITVTTDDSEDSEEITDTTENEDSEEDTDTTDTESSDSNESDCSGCVENMSSEKGSSDEDSTIYDFEYECLLEEECDDNGSEEKAEQQLKKKSTTDASRHKKRSSSICSCCSDTE
ncbi:hypothetical protein Tsp_05815 [Trichinella spiralis]|uniref:Uncharacterized protein n=1 Tax=Trichinella spiralis TaxID=6334 RepID=E5S4I9_TRISP|nr:hypothetical protein Tsp_05815 [Trichinella spiralis]KRY29284.1 hypothetical protein T01_1753 [Trichinella spiralis]